MVYLDHAATTPMYHEAIEAMTDVMRVVGNPSSLHTAGRTARRRMEESRESLAGLLQARPSEIIFTAGGTEGNNLAIKGIFWSRQEKQPHRRRIITTQVEHHAVLDTVAWLVEHQGAQVSYLPTQPDGSVTPDDLREQLEHGQSDDVALISIMWANNEVGTIMPIRQLASVAREFDIPIHSDAVQATGHIPVNFSTSGLSALTLTAHKFGGPAHTGALLLGRTTECTPLAHGGGQERAIRSGTPDVAGIVGMTKALQIACNTMEETTSRLVHLQNRLIREITTRIDHVWVNGSHNNRLPGNTHFTFEGCEGDSLLMLLDAQGIECSTGSACTAGVIRPSHVLLAMGADPITARGLLRLSLGHTSTDSDVDAVLDVLPTVVARARRAMIGAL